MRILILHRVPYVKIDYHRGISHEEHEVTYFGTDALLATVPDGLRCRRVRRPGTAPAFEEALAWLAGSAETFDRIISMSEYELLDAARLRERLGVPGASPEQVALSRDKYRMKAAVAAAGLRVPRFDTLHALVASDGRPEWTGPTVLKPVLGASSQDVQVYPTPAAAVAAVRGGTTGVPSMDHLHRIAAGGTHGADDVWSEFEAEEFVTGPIRHFDGLVQDGRVLTLSASEYVGTCLAYATGQPMGSFQTEYSAHTRSWVHRALAATRITDGSFHLEAIDPGDGELVFLEVGNRVGGADVVSSVELASGVHLPSFELRILLGESVADRLPVPPARPRWYGWFVLPGHHLHGRSFHGLSGVADLRGDPRVVSWTELPHGAPLPDHITYQAGETVLAGVLNGTDPSDTRDWMLGLFAAVSTRTRPQSLPA